MPRRQQGQQPSPELLARMAAVLRAIPPAFPAAEVQQATPPAGPPASPPDPRRRRSLSNATQAAWQQELGAAERRMQQLGVGRTRSEPGVQQRLAALPPQALLLPPPASNCPPPLPPAPPAVQPGQQPRPVTVSPLPATECKPGAPSPGRSRRLLRSMRHRAQLSPAAARPRPPPATPPSASRWQSDVGGTEASPRNTPFVVSPAAGPSLSPRSDGGTPLPSSPGRPSPKGAASPPPVRLPSPRLLGARTVPSDAAWLAEAAPAAVVAGGPPAAAAAEAASEAAAAGDPVRPLERLLSSLPRRLQADLLSLLRRQHDYVGARRQERQRALRRLQKRMGRLEEQWQRLLEGGGAAAGRQHALRLLCRLGAAPHRSRSEPHTGVAVLAGDVVPPLALEWSEPTLGGECLLEATLRPPSPASQRARPQQQAADRPGTPSALSPAGGASDGSGGGGAASRVPSLRGGAWSPPPATPRLPLVQETNGPWRVMAGAWQQPEPLALAGQHSLPQQGASTPLAAAIPPAAPQQQHASPADGGTTPRPPTALERLKQSHLYSPLPSRRSSFTHAAAAAAGETPADALVQVDSPGGQRPVAARKAQPAPAARPFTTPPRPGLPADGLLELRGHAIVAGAAGSPARNVTGAGGERGALGALKQRRWDRQLVAAAASRPTTAPS